MLELKKVSKVYKTQDYEIYALKNIDIAFREKEFVSILGPSGCGKTSLLNIIGGLDGYSSGEMLIDGQNTKGYSNKEWDIYRNHIIGFVFQNYNLIPHQTVLENVELALTIAGVGKQERRRRAKEALKNVGLENHIKKRPNQLSGGQMQRVAIARALVNHPDIILADEPTGALDTETSVEIMELLKEIAKEKMVIMVTHNPELASEYSDRIIRMKDGMVVGDSKAVSEEEKSIVLSENKIVKKRSMSRGAAWKLSFSNLLSKKKRTFITNFACSVGVTGIALILSLSAGIQVYTEKIQTEDEANNYILISKNRTEVPESLEEEQEYPENTKKVYPYDISETLGKNVIQLNQEYLQYVDKECSSLSREITYSYFDNLHILCKQNEMFETIPQETCHELLENQEFLQEQCKLLAGEKFPTEPGEIAIITDTYNRIPVEILNALGIDYVKDGIDYEELIGTEYRLVLNDDYYKEETVSEDKVIYRTPGSRKEQETAYENGMVLKVTCVIRGTKRLTGEWLSEGIGYTKKLGDMVRKDNAKSQILLAQRAEDDYNVQNGKPFSENTSTKTEVLKELGYAQIPESICIYPKNISKKEEVIQKLDRWNKENKKETVEYQDMSQIFSELFKILIKVITYVLVAFCGITLVVSSIMIAIIIYSSVIERTREIGILRALGASRKDVSRVFRTESVLLGLLSGVLSVIITWMLCGLINVIAASLTDVTGIAKLNGKIAVGVIALSTFITWIAGKIPAKLAAKKAPVTALRME